MTLNSGIKAKLIAFVVVALVATSYLGIKYAGINLLGSGYDVTVALPDAGGTFTNGEVTYRGVPVGRISSLHPTKAGMEAVLHIASDTPIPSDVDVKVADRSAIGEQYIDLAGNTTSTRMLADGDRIRGSAASMPPPIDELLRTGRDFIGSVDRNSLSTVINETYAASQGASAQLARLVDTSHRYAESANKNFLVTAGLIDNSGKVLATQQESAASIVGFSRDLNLIAATLRNSDGNLRSLIQNSPAAAREVYRLFDQVGAPLGTLMGNLVSTAQVFGINAAGVEDALVNVPQALSVGWAVNGSKGLNLGLAQTYFDPLPCTSGYGGTTVRPGLDLSPGRPFNIRSGCSLAPSSGVNVRGPGSVPARTPVAARVSVPSSLGDLLGGTQR